MPAIRRREHVTTKDMVTCRTIGHCWYPVDAERRPAFGTLWVLRCERCQARRDDIVDVHGDLSSRAYDYAEGYRDAGLGETRADRRRYLIEERFTEPASVTSIKGRRPRRGA
jgi:hypothetical protein